MSLRRIPPCFLVGLFLLGVAPPLLAAADDIPAQIAAAGDADKYDADLVIVLDTTDVTVREDGLGAATSHKVVKILRDGGIKNQSVQQFKFDPFTNRLELLAIRIYRADGSVEEVPLDDKSQQPQTAHGIFWDTQQFLLTVPRLEVGDAVETITKMTGFNVAYLAAEDGPEPNAYGEPLKPPVTGHWHDEVHFWGDYPIIVKRYTVRLPKDKPLQYEIYNGEVKVAASLDGDQMVYSFEKRDLRPLSHEPRMEPRQNHAPKLLLATLPTWEDKALWLHDVSEPQFEADDAIRAKTAEVIAGLKTDEEKYTALNHWVAENIRYAGTGRGMCEGYTVHKSQETFYDRCGVCKDKAGMLVTMLRCAGYDSFLVMTMARQRVDPVPADQFNHAVTCIRWPDGSLLLLDPTWMVKSRDNWSKLEPLQHVVYGLPENGGLSQSPYFPPEDNEAIWKATTAIGDDNTLTGKLDFVAVGAPEGRIRRTLCGLHPDQRQGWFDDTFQRLSANARPIDVQCTDPADFSGPLTIECGFEAEDYALGDGARRYLKLPMLQTVFGNRALYDLFGKTDADERKFGLSLLASRLGSFEETLRLPAGWTVTNLPDPIDIDGPAAGLHFEIESRPGEIHYTCKLVVKRWLIPADEYANFKEVIDKFEELAGHMIACELEGANAQR